MTCVVQSFWCCKKRQVKVKKRDGKKKVLDMKSNTLDELRRAAQQRSERAKDGGDCIGIYFFRTGRFRFDPRSPTLLNRTGTWKDERVEREGGGDPSRKS